MKLLKVGGRLSKTDLNSVIRCIGGNGVLIYPTDTVYGIGCCIESDCVSRIFEIKNRGYDKPLSIAFSDFDMMRRYVILDDDEMGFVRERLPGPFTLIAKKRKNVPDLVTGGRDTVGFRIPDNEIALQIISALGKPVVTTSANLSGGRAPAGFEDIDRGILGSVELAIDAGPCKLGQPSGVIDLSSMERVR